MQLLGLTLIFAAIAIFDASARIIPSRNFGGSCEPGKSYYDGCNTCFCTADGRASICTMKWCSSNDQVFDVEDPVPTRDIRKRSITKRSLQLPSKTWQQVDYKSANDKFLQQQQQQELFQQAEEDSQIQAQLDFQQAMENLKEELDSAQEDMDMQQDALDLQQAILDLEEEVQQEQQEEQLQQLQQPQQVEDYQIPVQKPFRYY